jgi:hypothetical protein
MRYLNYIFTTGVFPRFHYVFFENLLVEVRFQWPKRIPSRANQASVLHVAVGTVKSRLARGRDLLRDRIPRD